MTTPARPLPPADRTWVDVDLDALRANARTVAEVSGARLLPMVKANGYGLGAVPVARALEAVDPWGFGVAAVEEGIELRAAGISRPIVLFTPPLPGWLPAVRAHRITPGIADLEALRAWIALDPAAPFHVAIDAGMCRGGFPAHDAAALSELRRLLRGASGYEGAFTHFHSADTDAGSTGASWRAFHDAVAALGPRPALLHAANSAAALAGREFAADLVRPGIFLYGGRAGAGLPAPAPVATLKSRVVSVRRLRSGETVSYGGTWRAPGPVTVATVAIGYADGLPRAFAPRGVMHGGGRNLPVRGRVTMDMTVVESGEAVQPGDEVTVFGEALPIDAQAERAGTIAYELLTSLGRRVDRRYRGA
ncbi:MAG TPA: alanine racemase [Gemmatimonadales bacterium]